MIFHFSSPIFVTHSNSMTVLSNCKYCSYCSYWYFPRESLLVRVSVARFGFAMNFLNLRSSIFDSLRDWLRCVGWPSIEPIGARARVRLFVRFELPRVDGAQGQPKRDTANPAHRIERKKKRGPPLSQLNV